ncbi:protease complex subunit PrcB family protein [Flavobacterium litorale]|uniref:Protease complex subunit PrcB family protein n=1 Tax=Flavobacterium litorale TaxID=2856519 RepID=A0ABX8V491_9FLAO|nr:protease complex subunit PrcB family protein [Flavobacterium litorale]QYJ67654.1 protease complex subunit PrcB family protein [Flavobacterium litorale]
MKKALILTVLIGMLVSCKSKKDANGSLPFTILKEEAHGGREIPANQTARNQQELEQLYKQLNVADVPEVDFTKNNVIAVFLGQKRNGGYSVTIKKVVFDGDDTSKVIVLAKATEPKKDQAVTMALTSPYCVAIIPKTEKVAVMYIQDGFSTQK